MDLVVDGLHLGTPESVWASSNRLAQLPELRTLSPRRAVVVSPHPDDEVFGAAGLLHALASRGAVIEIVAVTDGEGSHPLAVERGLDLRTLRARERRRALTRLGLETSIVTRLAVPDGDVGSYAHHISQVLVDLLKPGDLCIAPWEGDGHPDHNASGLSARVAAQEAGADLVQFLVWAWHWADPDSDDLPWSRCRRLNLPRRVAARKRWASAAFRSQTQPLGDDRDGEPLLPPPVLRRLLRTFEVYIEGEASP
jgi:LmbE family N-acetylglucosaminyl deacetylase